MTAIAPQLTNLLPARRDCGRENVGAELKFQSQSEVARKGEPNRGELGQVLRGKLPQKLNDRDHDPDRN